MSEEQNKAPNEGEARVLSDDELKGIVGGGGVVGGGAARMRGEDLKIAKGERARVMVSGEMVSLS